MKRAKSIFLWWCERSEQRRDRFFFITEFRPGRVFNGSESDIYQILLALRDFQKAANDFDVKDTHKQKSYEPLITIFGLLNGVTKDQLSKNQIILIKEIIESLKRNYDAIPETRYVMSHGDFALFNIILNGEEIVGINDFDNVAYLPLIHDLAEFLVSASIVHYLGPISNLRLPVFTQPHQRVFSQILTFYKENFSLTAEEIRLLAVVVEMVWLEILLLGVLKGDYKLADISNAVNEIGKRTVQSRVLKELQSQEKNIFIWDFHGTLETGTLSILTEIANTLLKENGSNKQYLAAELASIPSFSWNTFFRNHFPNFSEKEIEAIAQQAYDEKRFAPLLEKYSRPNVGAETILQAVRDGGGVNVVVSHSRHDKLGHYINRLGLDRFIDEYYGIDDGTIVSKEDVLKKKTMVMRDILNQYDSYHSYAVGDTDKDFNAARSAGINMFYWLLPTKNNGLEKELYKRMLSQKLKFINQLNEILQDL
ncbi:MAG: hypothetical protein A3J55_02805 [Candidatus Ryanbacteria bacterium RIFCSPHIGHO2_02_FULL_45_17b]|uniref:Aminoglycoside phosphotransferase domain-containing protein n=1 Tax=Candidatus Ryanbacteria bacterium RIFCSPHIGHO2_01_FULL_45_22 TaxID=1802114 RepID=A0A1G2FZE3_9BACT|nr:MAG: hypothetical protein A2719_05655 [Candidatus Ryanbacteria bacterium RIFCSPHIGHO2_01_FULL_45_22]OGZ47342.1 MAG: hypothetical protein A3J55_02805 [Candidatus Ryanbacteria bacterium RIFCSPHIGHO2_02_FULL_45_17b]